MPRSNLPVTYANQSNAWMNAKIFLDWFHHTFVPYIQQKLREMNLEPKVILLDNCPAHPDELVSDNGRVIGKFLPTNVTSLIQPMDQGVLESIKRCYRRKILEKLLHESTIVQFLKGIHMLNVSTGISASWNEITAHTLRLSWWKILPEGATVHVQADQEDHVSKHDVHVQADQEVRIQADQEDHASEHKFRSLFNLLGYDISGCEVTEWLQADKADRGYDCLSDDEFVTAVVGDEEESDDDDDDEVEEEKVIPHDKAVKMFDRCLEWLLQQDDMCFKLYSPTGVS